MSSWQCDACDLTVTEGPVYGTCWSDLRGASDWQLRAVHSRSPTEWPEPTDAPALEVPDSDLIVTFAEAVCALTNPLDLHAGEITGSIVVPADARAGLRR